MYMVFQLVWGLPQIRDAREQCCQLRKLPLPDDSTFNQAPILFILASRYPAKIKLANIYLKQNFAKYNFHQYFRPYGIFCKASLNDIFDYI